MSTSDDKSKIATKANRVSVITIHGTISANESREGIYPELMRQYFEEAVKNKSELIILDINSPGGSPVGSAMIHHMILTLREKGVKVVAHCRDVCASGGYLIVSACDAIYAYRSSLIGSIGVIMYGFGFDEFIKKQDIEYREITAGSHKSFFNMFKPLESTDREYLEGIIGDVHADFIDSVFNARENDLLQANRNDVTEAKVYNGVQAKAVGLIDDYKTIREILLDRYDDENKVKLHRPKIKSGLLKRFFSNGINVNLKPDIQPFGMRFE